MKKISIITRIRKTLMVSSVVALSLGITSCEDWLDMPSYTTSDTETVFADENTADMFLQGCYRGLVHQEMYYQLGMGETMVHSSEDGSTNNSKYNICNYFYDTTSPYTVTTIFKEQYRIIESTNIAISRLNGMPETDKRNALIGEALAIRAFCYHNLIRIYGDVPAVWEPLEEMDPDDEDTFYPRRSPRDEIYDRIIADLQTAVTYIPWYSESGYNTYERLTKQGTYAMLARVALYAGGYSLRWDLETNAASSLRMARRDDEARVREFYQIASDACQAIISKNENALVQAQGGKSGFEYLWYNFCQRNFSATSPEMLWELAQYGNNTNSAFGVYAHPGSRGGTFGSRKAMQFLLPTYYLSFDPNDTRRDVSCTSYSIYFLDGGSATDTFVDVGTTYSCIMAGKFRISWCVEPADASKRNLNIPLLRYADVLLMYAETQNYLNNGPTQAAKDALQQVRDRAGIGNMSIPSTQQEFEDALVQEMKWEFACEFNLRTDLIRMNRLAKELAETKQAMKDLSDRKNAYANVPVYRLYKFQVDAQTYGDPFLALDYIELTDPAEIALIRDVPTDADDYDAFQDVLAGILAAHGVTVEAGDKWYPTHMFEAYTSTYNGNARKAVGFTNGFNALQIGNIIYTKPTGSAENGGSYPDWIEAADGSDGLYYGFKENCVELLPFAAQAAGHPMIDNPNLTQHPGYQ
ncbi:MAG: RagB/SusD family nutrient uptake outer membrane protein [Bacteroides sp.]|nr:RagB/SusD family nutrient uptake outer membrane protein [Bacteroides sp.]